MPPHTVQAAHPGGDVGAGTVVDTHHRDALAGGQFEQPGQFLAVGGIHGARGTVKSWPYRATSRLLTLIIAVTSEAPSRFGPQFW